MPWTCAGPKRSGLVVGAPGVELTDLGPSTGDHLGATNGNAELLALAVLTLDELAVLTLAGLGGPVVVHALNRDLLGRVDLAPDGTVDKTLPSGASAPHDDGSSELELLDGEGDLVVLGGEEELGLLLELAERDPAGLAVELTVLEVETRQLGDRLEEDLETRGGVDGSHNCPLFLSWAFAHE